MLNALAARRTALTIAGVVMLLSVGALATACPPTMRINAAVKKVAGRKSSTNRKAVRDETSARPLDGSPGSIAGLNSVAGSRAPASARGAGRTG